MKNLHLLPTDKPSRLKQNKITKKISLVNKGIDLTSYTPINIYITSDEEIKDCWVFNTLTNQVYFLQGFYGRQIVKKIILTTDQDLINDGVQAIDDEFLNWFVNNPSCEFVEVELIDTFKKTNEVYVDEITSGNYYEIIKKYKIIIPKEEPKQETLEEAALKYSDGNTLEFAYMQEIPAFKAGAKWQQERMYSEAEVLALIHKRMIYTLGDNYQETTTLKWFEQFKKKTQ